MQGSFLRYKAFTHACVLWCESGGANHPKGQSNIPQIFTALQTLINSSALRRWPHRASSPCSSSGFLVTSRRKEKRKRNIPTCPSVILTPKLLLIYQHLVALAWIILLE